MMSLSVSHALVAVCLLCSLLSVSAFFALNSPKLVIERLDPLVNQGGIANHLHTILGGSNWKDTYSYENSIASDCTTMPVSVDKSNYWTPTLYYVHPDLKSFEVVPLGFGRIYYLPRPGPTQKNKIVAFPKGFRMVAGDMNRRFFNASRQQDKAISFVCLDYYGSHSNDPDWFQRNDFFTTHNCPNGMRLQFNFPACWDGVNLYKDDNSHVAYTIQNVDSGDCPSTHPVHFVNLFFEFIYDTQNFPINTKTDINPQGTTWVLSNGDTTGYGFHGDFTNGWDVDVLQAALDKCDDAGGDPAKCAPFAPYMQEGTESCHPSKNILNEKVGLNGAAIPYLPGCNKLWYGTGPKPTCDADWPGLKTNIAYESASSVLPDGYSRLGCFAEAPNGHALMGGFQDFPGTNTGAQCAAYCQSLNFSLAAVEYEHQCYCGSQMTNGGSLSVNAPSSKCNDVCPGRYTESCGGNNFMQVMFNPSLRPAAAPVASTLAPHWFRDGCIAEAQSGRLFTGATMPPSDNMTPAKCVAWCSNKAVNGIANFSYAGTEYGRECYCSATLPASTSPRAADAKCSMTCGGASSLPCGGPGYMSLYSLRPEWKVAALNNTALPVSWKPLGCFGIGAAQAVSALTKAPFFTDSAMTNGMCAQRCAQYSASYAVTQYGSQCFCGDADSIAALTRASSALAPEQCDMTCGGSVLERCGGISTSSVMLTGKPGAGATQPSTSGDSSSSGSSTAQPVASTDTTVKLRIRVNKAASATDYSFLSTLRLLIAKMLGIDSYRVVVTVETPSTATPSTAGRRLLEIDNSATTFVIVAFLPATTDMPSNATSAGLAAQFMSSFADSKSPLSQTLSAQEVDTSYPPQPVDSSSSSPSSSSSSSKVSLIVGVVVGGVVLLAAIIVTVVLLRRRKASSDSMNKMKTNSGSEIAQSYKV